MPAPQGARPGRDGSGDAQSRQARRVQAREAPKLGSRPEAREGMPDQGEKTRLWGRMDREGVMANEGAKAKKKKKKRKQAR